MILDDFMPEIDADDEPPPRIDEDIEDDALLHE